MKKIKKLFILIIFSILLTGCGIQITTTGNNTTVNRLTTKPIVTTLDSDTISTNTTIDPNLPPEYYTTTTKDNRPTTTKAPSVSSVDSVYFMEINDTHGQLYSEYNTPSLAQVEVKVSELEKNANQDYIEIMNGDLMQGSYISRMTYGRALIEALNAMDFDMMTLGNHEFDWGLPTILAYWDGDITNGEASFPLVCANIVDLNTNKLPTGITPYFIKDYHGLRVGIIGTIGETLESSISAEYVSGLYEFTSVEEACKKYVPILRGQEGCDVVVLATHDYESSTLNTLSNLPEGSHLDAFLCGHTHQSIDETYTRGFDGYNIPCVQSYTKNGNFGTIKLNLDGDNKAISSEINHYSVKYNTQAEDENVRAVLDKYRSIYNEGREILGGTNAYLNKNALATMMNNAIIDKVDADICFINSAGVRATIQSGNVTKADVFEVFPFDNTVVYKDMTGYQLRTKLKDYITGYLYTERNGFSLDNIDDSETYRVATISYVAQSYSFRNIFTSNCYTEYLMRDVLMERIGGYLDIKKENCKADQPLTLTTVKHQEPFDTK